MNIIEKQFQFLTFKNVTAENKNNLISIYNISVIKLSSLSFTKNIRHSRTSKKNVLSFSPEELLLRPGAIR